MASAEVSLPAVFTTRTPYPLPSQKFMIPASWRRFQLSQLVNKVLALPTPVPFDFLIQGEVLRGTLSEWCNERGFGMEETLEIEYIESLLPPQQLANIPHDDWVSSVSCRLNGQFITGSYDARIRVFDSSQNNTHEIMGHTAPVTSVCVLLSTTSESPVIASASHDGTARMTAVENDLSNPLASLHLHTLPISSITSSISGSHLLTASWDTLIGLWDTKIPHHDEVPREQEERKKRRKVGEENSSVEMKRKAPVSVLKSHTGRVMKAIFSRDGRQAFSCALDSTVRTWDVDSGVCLNTMTAPEKPFLDLTAPSEGNTIFAASTDRTVIIYDTRQLSAQGNGSSSAIGSMVHPATPSCLAVSPVNVQHVASGCYDGVVRIWDIRSVKGAISNFRVTPKTNGDGKVLAIDWTKGIIAAGGEGGLDIWKVSEEGSSSFSAS